MFLKLAHFRGEEEEEGEGEGEEGERINWPKTVIFEIAQLFF